MKGWKGYYWQASAKASMRRASSKATRLESCAWLLTGSATMTTWEWVCWLTSSGCRGYCYC